MQIEELMDEIQDEDDTRSLPGFFLFDDFTEASNSDTDMPDLDFVTEIIFFLYYD